MSKFDDLVKKLKEIFQIDRPELDFGVYRILNSRVVEINDYLDNRLKAKVNESLASSGAASIAALQTELSKKEAQYLADGMVPETVPGVLALRQKIADYGTGVSEHENTVFTHLLTFFSRYYDKGDFISQRRYKGDTYAIPYAGEEVMLHWANKDQYYTKSGENFSNYGFKLDDGRTVSFRLVTADTAKDNRKDNDKERRFALIEPHTRTLVDDEGDEYEETLLPVEVVNGELVLRFEYKAMPKGTKQEELVGAAVRTILDDPTVKSHWRDLSKREPTEKNPQRTLLEKCLTNYTTRNSADYFIHKDLGGFLRRELDFYIKNEVMHLDDVQNAEKFADIEKSLRMIQTLRSIALDLITFLAQLEEFQKKLWLKKKFVVSAHYCVTLDRLPESLYPAIAANQKQWEQWESLGMLDAVAVDKPGLFSNPKIGSVEYLKAHPYLMVDSALFDAAFKSSLLAAVDNLDESLDGLLIHGDNFQALNLLQERYREQVKCVYIDPPYNAQSSEILYKNTYKHSSWLSLIQDRVGVSLPLLEDVFVYVTAIDEVENMRLGQMYFDLFAGCEDACVSIVHNPTGQQGDNFSYTHEFAHFVYPQNMNCIGLEDRDDPLRESKPDIRPLRNVSSGKNHFRQSAANCFYPIFIKEGKIVGFGDVCLDDFHPQNINEKGDNGVINVYPIDPSGAESKWVFARQKVESIRDELTAEYNQKKKTWDIIREKRRFRYKSLWEDKRYSANSWGSVVLNGMFPGNSFTYPKSIYTVRDCVDAGLSNSKEGTILDYFAGSGTTGHAVIALNREDKGKRKYILVEQGEYFDTVLKPRIQKVVYSAEWKDGKATAPRTGISHSFKVLKIESYEDTLNNLHLRRTPKQQELLDSLPKSAQEEYLLSYLLDIESRGSLLSVEHFKKPFDCKLKVTVDSAGAYEERTIDLVETFNYLIGLRVKLMEIAVDRGYARVEGNLPTGESVLIIWRDCERIGYEELKRYTNRFDLYSRKETFEVIYINGDHNIPAVFTATEAEGGITKTLKLRQIEPEFLSRMFSVEGV